MELPIQSLFEVFNLLPDAILLVNKEGIIIESNQQSLPVLGYEPIELKGKPVDLLIPERFHSKHAHNVESYSKAGSPRKMGPGMKLIARKKNGNEFDVDIALSPIKQGETFLTLAVVRDISDNLKLSRRIGRLEKNKEELEKFAMVTSHDLKAPLQRVKMLVYLITQQLSAQDKAQINDFVNHLNTSIATMEKLISGILEYAKVSHEEKNNIINLNQVIDEVKQNIIVPMHFNIRVSKPLPALKGNYTKILQVFLNLMTNAIKYNDKQEGILQIDWAEDVQTYTFFFVDNGVIVPPEKREEIFKLFKTANEQPDAHSHGVGLSIVQKIVEEANGRIWYEESSLGGSCFVIQWPKMDESQFI